MKITDLRRMAACVTLAATLAATPATADDVYWVGGPQPGSWNTQSNWRVADGSGLGPNAVPDASFNDIAFIGNGATAQLSAAAEFPIGELRLGSLEIELSSVYGSGALEISTGGSLQVVANGVTSGSVFIGRVPSGAAQLGATVDDAQQGSLVLSGNGSLSADGRFFLERRNNAAPVLTMSGSSSIAVGGDSDLRGVMRMVGPDLTYTSDTMQWGGQLRLIPEITGAMHSVLSVTGAATLNAGATIAPEFATAPTGGESFTIVSASSISDLGVVLDGSNAGLGDGLRLNGFVDNSGANAEYKVTVEQALKLIVDRTTGAVSIENVHGSGIGIKGYSIQSPSGSLASGDSNWTSFEDTGSDGGTWFEANPSAAALNELNLEGVHTFAPTSTTAFGVPYQPAVTEFGVLRPDDLTLTYQTDGGVTVEGIVEYTGRVNTLVLRVDPATGNAVVTNESQFTADINGYSVTSGDGAPGSGSLLTAWDSLSEQSVGTWQEANPSTEALNELNPDQSLLLAPGQSFQLAGLWDTAGAQDLDFEFALAGGAGAIDGVVLYEAASTVLQGDFNDDGVVNAADYTVWRDNLGAGAAALNGNGSGGSTVVIADYQLWKANFGLTNAPPFAASLAVAAPEPNSVAVMLAACVAAILGRRRTAFCSLAPSVGEPPRGVHGIALR